MADLTATRWRRYGKDRLYVATPDDAQVGWVCLQTGEVSIGDAAQCADFESAVAGWRAANALPTSSDRNSTAPLDDSASSAQPSSAPADLAQTRPGAAAREQAIARKQEAPVRTAIARVLGVHTEERAWRLGAKGEEKVAAQLAKLEPQWKTLHALSVGERGSDIDHLVIGPGGVFTLNAKHHPGGKVWVAGDNMRVNGQPAYYVRSARHEARRAGQLLSAACGTPIAVMGIVVLVGADDLTVREQPADVIVVNRRRVAKMLAACAQVLDPRAVDAVFDVARREDTWKPPRSP